ncbi:glycoside hydrolase family 28 protein [Mucilaginibacter sp. SJ]|uniref:glycoside hydrolase family 28 protein n=1 Tax=Mucilaginibacter sp. SJ TaxID=3029053 RepID=UPI0023A9A80B|nr:glycosyl hydrolase family 28 protein [Mucilaginibacter sp. SJ]WEA01884.1 glycosyl hydrolase family 28 protein [Mucilaginibacter sp. SJ]
MYRLTRLLLCIGVTLLASDCSLFAADVDITAYGATGNGTTLNTAAIQNAIDVCYKSGGGKVVVPSGVFLTGTVALNDNITLHLNKGAVLLGSTDINDYRNLDPFVEGLGISVGWALVVAVDKKNISIEGKGVIDGQGVKLKAQQILTDTRAESQRWGRRPFLLRVVRCQNVFVQGVTLNYSAAWTSHYFQCKQVNIQNVKIESRGVAHNDGMDIDGCQDVTIKNCDVVSGDDALCFKTTSSKMACRDIVISGLRLKSGQGAIKIGTESMAPFENIRISKCYIYDTANGGIKLLSVDGANIRNIEIDDITMVEVKTPILIRLGARLSVFRKDQDTQQPIGTLENVTIKNVKAKAADIAQLMPPSGILITGIPGHDIKGLTLKNIEINLAGGGSEENARQIVPEAIDKYPEVKTFGPLVPAYGVWARHIEGLKLDNIKFTLGNNDLRPALICEDGKNIELNSCIIPETTGAKAVIRLENVAGARINNTAVAGSAGAFVRVEGTASNNVHLLKNKTPGIQKKVDLSADVKAGTAILD